MRMVKYNITIEKAVWVCQPGIALEKHLDERRA